jgi:hypothetical protein
MQWIKRIAYFEYEIRTEEVAIGLYQALTNLRGVFWFISSVCARCFAESFAFLFCILISQGYAAVLHWISL